jgi:hypothetical protein
MKTLREVAQILERSSVKQIAQDLQLQAPVSLRQILKFEFIESQKLRNNIVAATQSFKGKFPSPGQPWNNGFGLNESQVNSFFTGSSYQIVDCLGAAVIIMARGLIQTLKPGEFDKLGYTSGMSSMHLNYRTVANIDQMTIGDWGYIRNDWRYLEKHPGGGYQGENIIKVSASIYYGFPAGKKTYAQWVQALIDAYNSGLPPNEHISNIPGFQGNDNKTFDVRTINLNVWKLRKP